MLEFVESCSDFALSESRMLQNLAKLHDTYRMLQREGKGFILFTACIKFKRSPLLELTLKRFKHEDYHLLTLDWPLKLQRHYKSKDYLGLHIEA